MYNILHSHLRYGTDINIYIYLASWGSDIQHSLLASLSLKRSPVWPPIQNVSVNEVTNTMMAAWRLTPPHTTPTVISASMEDRREETKLTNQQILANNEHILLIICEKKHPDVPFIAVQSGY